jgi:CubicO group peptidase (beta-lactamase class C family)
MAFNLPENHSGPGPTGYAASGMPAAEKSRRIALLSSAIAALIAALIGALFIALWARPPELLRVGANYAAKMVCSNVYLAGRDPAEVLRDDVQAPGAFLLRLMRVSVDPAHGLVRAGLLGFIGDGLAAVRPDRSCVTVPGGSLEGVSGLDPLRAGAPPVPVALEPVALESATPQPAAHAPGAGAAEVGGDWPDGEAVRTDPTLDRLIADDALAGPATRAVIVVHRGRIVAERYGRGFNARMPQLGWSMAKSVTAGLVGSLIQQGRLTLDASARWPPGDARAAIKIRDLLAMSSGLEWNEAYGAVSDVTRMLFLEPDTAAFARNHPLVHPAGSFWNYSSGGAVILSRLVQDATDGSSASAARALLFGPLGMRSAVIETDAHGTLVGSSYMYATPRDWARYAQFLLQQGVWHGQALLPPGYVALMATPVAASHGQYGQGLVWLWGSDGETPGQNPDAAFGIPPDTFWMEGHDGQFIAIVPSRELVVVRLGLTPARLHYRPQSLVKALLAALP